MVLEKSDSSRLRMGIIKREDWKYVPKDPEPNFSPERNKRIIKETIEDSDRKRKEARKNWTKDMRERTDAIAQYLTSDHGATVNKRVERYFGKKQLTRLRGEDILTMLKGDVSQGNQIVAAGGGMRVDKDPWIKHDVKEE